MLKKSGALLFFLLILNICFSQNIVINEVLSVNNHGIQDEDGEHSDWIELFNTSSEFVSLDGYFLSDQLNTPHLFALPPIDLLPGEFLVVFCSGKDRSPINGEIHSNFKISSNEESVLLTDPLDNQSIFQVEYIGDDTSRGSYPDAGVEKIHFNQPTPGYSNTQNNGWNQVQSSHKGGIYPNPVSLTLSTLHANSEIRYTLDGNRPSSESPLYIAPILLNESTLSSSTIATSALGPIEQYPILSHCNDIDKSIVVRSACFNEFGDQVSETLTQTFFITDLTLQHSIPVVSICCDEDSLLDFEKGIFVPGINFDPEQADWTGNYYEYGRDWERSAHVEYFKDSKLNYSSSIGLRTHGGNSRRNPQKGMRLYARTEYGNQKFRQSFFGQNGPDDFKRLVLKPMSSAWTYAGMQDMLCNRMTENPELNIHGVNSSPVALYINGIYWGLYQLQEHVDKHFISTHYQLNEDDYDLIKDWYGEADIGNNEAWNHLYNFIEENDLSDPINYSYVESQIDLGNFIDYQIFQTFIANRDWPANNMICWKGHDHDQKWRWVFKDGDAAMLQLDLNYVSHSLSTSDVFWPTNATSTLFLRKLLANQFFEDRFYHRFTQLINGIWKYEELRELFNEGVTEFHDEVVAQNVRFSFLANYSQWLTTIDKLNYFLQNRACELDQQLKSELNRSINPPSCILSETEVSQVEIFPNPNMSQFTFSFYSTHSKNIAVNVRNFHGRIIHTMPFPAVSGFNSVELNHLSLPAGVYLIEVEADFSKAIAKMIVIR